MRLVPWSQQMDDLSIMDLVDFETLVLWLTLNSETNDMDE